MRDETRNEFYARYPDAPRKFDRSPFPDKMMWYNNLEEYKAGIEIWCLVNGLDFDKIWAEQQECSDRQWMAIAEDANRRLNR